MTLDGILYAVLVAASFLVILFGGMALILSLVLWDLAKFVESVWNGYKR